MDREVSFRAARMMKNRKLKARAVQYQHAQLRLLSPHAPPPSATLAVLSILVVAVVVLRTYVGYIHTVRLLVVVVLPPRTPYILHKSKH